MEHIDALEAVRRLTLERDALAKQLKDTNALMEKIKQSVLIDHLIPGGQDGLFHAVDWICFALRDEKKKRAAVMAERDALAEQVKRLEDSVVWHREELERTRTEWEQQENALQAPERHERHETGAESQTCDGCKHGRRSLRDKMVCTRNAPKHGERMMDNRLNKFIDLMGQHNALFLGNIPASALDDE